MKVELGVVEKLRFMSMGILSRVLFVNGLIGIPWWGNKKPACWRVFC